MHTAEQGAAKRHQAEKAAKSEGKEAKAEANGAAKAGDIRSLFQAAPQNAPPAAAGKDAIAVKAAEIAAMDLTGDAKKDAKEASAAPEKTVNDGLLNSAAVEPPHGVLLVDKDLKNNGYYAPKGEESWLWKWCKLHEKWPGWYQCQIPLGETKDGSNPLCLQWLSYSSAGNLGQHSKCATHKAWAAEHKPSDAPPTNRGRPGLNLFTGASSTAKFNRLLAAWIACSYSPLDVVNHPFFLDMIRSVAGPHVELPSRPTITEQIARFADDIKEQVLFSFF